MRISGISGLGLISLLILHTTVVLAAVLGIDYGQEYTKGSLVAPGVPFEIVLTTDGKRKDLSGLTFKKIPGSKDGEIERVYGNSAQSLANRLPDSSAFYFKPLLGMPLDTKSNGPVSSYRTRFPGASMVPSNNNRGTTSFNFHGENYPVEEALAMSFSDLKRRAGDLLVENGGSGYVRDAAVTIPHHFTIEQRRALEDAVEISGLKLISLINDGVAVAVNFASSRSFDTDKQYHVIYDVGAGATSATLVSIRQGEIPDSSSRIAKSGVIIDVEGIGYDAEVGGHLLTERVRGLLVDKFLAANPSVKRDKLLADHKALAKLWTEANRVKYILSANTETHSSLESVHNDIDFKTMVGRNELEELSQELKPRVSQPITDALSKPLNTSNSPVGIDQVESIILTGGSVRVPFIQQELKNIFGESVSLAKNVNADESAVLGAALRGVGISKIFKSRDIHVIDRAVWDYDISINGDKQHQVLFPRGTPLDTTVTVPLDAVDTKDGFSIQLYEDSREFISYDASNVQKTIKEVKNNAKKTCVDDVTLEADFTLTHSRTVELSSIRAKCMAKDKEVSSTSSETTSSDETATETSTTTATTSNDKPAKELSREISVKPKFNGPRPMGTSSKSSAISRLKTMDKADTERQNKEEAKNTLEGNIYKLRDILSSGNDDVDPSAIEKAEKKLDEYSEWLDIEGQTASLKELNEKKSQLKKLHESLFPGSVPSSTATTTSTATATSESSTSTTSEEAEESKLTEEETSMLNKLGFIFGSNRAVNNMLHEAGIESPDQIKVGDDILDKYIEAEKADSKSLSDQIDDATSLLQDVVNIDKRKDLSEEGEKEVKDRIHKLEREIEASKQVVANNRKTRKNAIRGILGLSEEKTTQSSSSSTTTTTTTSDYSTSSSSSSSTTTTTERVRDEL